MTTLVSHLHCDDGGSFQDFLALKMVNPPRTYQEAMSFMKQYENVPLVITMAEIPFLILEASSGWCHICGHTKEELTGRSFRIIQGAHTDPVATEHLCEAAQRGEEAEAVVYNYHKDGHVFCNYIQIFPLVDATNPAKITHYLGFFQDVTDACRDRSPEESTA